RDVSSRREPIGCSGPAEKRIGGDPFPECAQLCDALLGGIPRDDCGVDRADRDPGDPIRVEIHLRKRLVYARLIRAECPAALEQQRNALEGWTGWHAVRPISHDGMHGVMPRWTVAWLAVKSVNPLCPSNSHSTGTSAGAPLSLIMNTRNFAGAASLAFRST